MHACSPDVALLRQTLFAHLRDLRSKRRDFQQKTLTRVGQVVLHLRENEAQHMTSRYVTITVNAVIATANHLNNPSYDKIQLLFRKISTIP